MNKNETQLTIDTLNQTVTELTKRNTLLEARLGLWSKPNIKPKEGVEQLTMDMLIEIFMDQAEMTTRCMFIALKAGKQRPLDREQATIINRLVFENAIQTLAWALYTRSMGFDFAVLENIDPVRLNEVVKEYCERTGTTGVEISEMKPASTHSKS